MEVNKIKVLVTGFDPFGGEKVNPAYEAVKLIPTTIAGAEIIKIEIPTVFGKADKVVEEAIIKHNPDIVLCIGQAGGRFNMTVEKIAMNLADGSIPDNEGNQPIDETIDADGETAYFSTLPVKAMVANMREAGIPAFVSYSAGSYVCNYIMYCVLNMAAKKYQNIKAGFIHVPFATEQGIGKGSNIPTMSLTNIAKGIEVSIEAIVNNSSDIKVTAGQTH